MLNDVMKFYGLVKDFPKAGYFETEHHQQIHKELKAAINQGKPAALTGIIGCGKTTILRRIQNELRQEKQILVSKILSIEKGRVSLNTLMTALFYDLNTDKNFTIPNQSEIRERKLRDIIRKQEKPVVLMVDDAHDLHFKTIVGLKRLIEVIQDDGGNLSILLAGHPKLKNDLRKATMEEIGARMTIFAMEGIGKDKQKYIEWLIDECSNHKTKPNDIVSRDAVNMLVERLATPLQIESYLTLVFEEAYKIGEKPITHGIIESVLAKDINELEPKLTRQGYNAKALASLLNIRHSEIKSFLHGQLPPARAQELKNEMLAAGIPM